MKINKLNRHFYALITLFSLILFLPALTDAQRRDYLTAEEIELVRDAQPIDLRVAILTKAIDRRFLVINNDNSQAKQVEKDLEKWGELPKGSRSLLVWDIERILQKSIDDIDDTAAHSKIDEKLFPKAMFVLTDFCQQYIPKFRTLYDSAADEKEKGLIIGSIDNCNQIIEASAKVTRPTPKESKKKSKKDSN